MIIELTKLISEEELAKALWISCEKRREVADNEGKKIKKPPRVNPAIMNMMKKTA